MNIGNVSVSVAVTWRL